MHTSALGLVQVLTYSPGARSAGTSNKSTISKSNGPHAPEHLQAESGLLIDAPVHAGLSLQRGGKVAVPDSELGILRARRYMAIVHHCVFNFISVRWLECNNALMESER